MYLDVILESIVKKTKCSVQKYLEENAQFHFMESLIFFDGQKILFSHFLHKFSKTFLFIFSHMNLL